MKFYDKHGGTHTSVTESIVTDVIGKPKYKSPNPIRKSIEPVDLPEKIIIPAEPAARLSVLLNRKKDSIRVEDESGNVLTEQQMDTRVIDAEHWNQIENEAAKLHSVKDDKCYEALKNYLDKH